MLSRIALWCSFPNVGGCYARSSRRASHMGLASTRVVAATQDEDAKRRAIVGLQIGKRRCRFYETPSLTASSRVDQHAGVHQSLRVKRALGAAQRLRE